MRGGDGPDAGCPDCGRPAPRRRLHDDGSEHACPSCGLVFSLWAGRPGQPSPFFPGDVLDALNSDAEPLWPGDPPGGDTHD